MGFFDFAEDMLDVAVNLPGKVLELGTEAIVRSPEIAIKAVEGVANGVEKGIEKVEKALD